MSASPPQDDFESVIRGFRAWVETQRGAGLEAFPKASSRPLADANPVVSPAASATDGPNGETLETIRTNLGDCERCKLCEGRKNIVFGVGNPTARIVFVGEGPGEEEDRRGEPFVGRAGQLLTDIITGGMGLSRADVYIANVVKCRPPNNRNPEPDEITACQPFLLRQLGAIGPEVVIALGKFAAQTLLQTRTPISKLRGRWHEFRGTRLMPTFHPSYLLRNPSDKRLVWEDIQMVMKELGLPLPDRSSRPGSPK